MTIDPSPPAGAAPSSTDADWQARERVCALCRHMYQIGWASGTGGGFSLRQGDRIYIAPSAVPKESIEPEEVYVTDLDGKILVPGRARPGGIVAQCGTSLKISACTPLFLAAYQHRGAGAVLHSHSVHACLASVVFGRSFRVRGLEMVKGIEGGHVDVVHEVPILDNTPFEAELEDSVRKAMIDHPQSSAVLVRGHGVYIWGRDWVHVKGQAECYDFLFQTAVRLHELGIDPATLDRRLT